MPTKQYFTSAVIYVSQVGESKVQSSSCFILHNLSLASHVTITLTKTPSRPWGLNTFTTLVRLLLLAVLITEVSDIGNPSTSCLPPARPLPRPARPSPHPARPLPCPTPPRESVLAITTRVRQWRLLRGH